MTTNGGVKPPVVRLKRAPESSAVFHPLSPPSGAGVKAKAFWIGTSAKQARTTGDEEKRSEHK
jgi:hypothetical protein